MLYQDDLRGKVIKQHVVRSSFGDLGWGDGHLWQLQRSPHAVFKIGPDGTVVAGYHLPDEAARLVDNIRNYPTGLAFAEGGYLWIGVTRIDLDATSDSRNHLLKLKIPDREWREAD